VLSLASIFPLLGGNSQAEHFFAPSPDVGAQKSLDVMVFHESLHIESGGELVLFITVTSAGFPMEDALVNITCTAPDFCDFRFEDRYTDIDGKAIAYMTAYSEEGMVIDITVTASIEGYIVGIDVIDTVTIEPPVEIIPKEDIPSYISITGIITLLIIASTEVGKYGLFKSIVVPLYSRLKKDELLEHFVRGQIYGRIMSHPGEHYNHIKQKLGVTNGTLSHHLRTLELQGYIKSHRDGTYKRFYPTGMKIPRKKGIQLSDLQMGIVDAIRQSPGISQKDIAQREGISQQSVSYNLTILERMGILDSVRDGVRNKYFISSDS
ncbi:MAG: winged helix-turn-helix transcriptional regulator, partial [Thermoplasmata archaeon]|nr:winged helix-turn-helix transcriptional regulator [Thermoplasmata archaeon]